MDIRIFPRSLRGDVTVIPSKSQAHRLLICAAFADSPTQLRCPETNRDIEATADCLRALGAEIIRTETGYTVFPAAHAPEAAVLPCRDSGSTLRFLLPVAGALGVDATFLMGGRLPQRPLSPLWEELERMGCTLSRPSENTIRCRGKLLSGDYFIDGSVSSQFITGLMLALPLLHGESHIPITGKIESRPYVELTRQTLRTFGLDPDRPGSKQFHSPEALTVEGDWSNGAFFLAAKALGNAVEVTNLHPDSPQGDRAIANLLTNLDCAAHISAADIPDLVPILAVVYGAKNGAVIEDIARLRLKESDRVASVCSMLKQLGTDAVATENTLTVSPGRYHGCTIDAVGDHRIAMAAAIAATVADGPVTIKGAECVAKSYPTFWQEYQNLGGHYEQYLR